MTDHASTVIPAGQALLDAAAWVGASCWYELRLHERLTDVLARGVGPERSAELWAIRAHRAEAAEAWHRRLPELREFPREGFVTPDDERDPRLLPADGVDDSNQEVGWLADALDALADRYWGHVDVAVGPADGPTAATLRAAIVGVMEDRDVLELLRSP